MRPAKVLVIEDDKKLAGTLHAGISAEGYDVSCAGAAEEGFYLIHSQSPDLVVLDVTLPQRSGLDLLRQLRQENHRVRVLLLTSHNTVEHRVDGLRLGADDYLGKPFAFAELLARIESLLRRAPEPAAGGALVIGDLSIYPERRAAARQGKPLELTAREFDVLLYLAENQRCTVSRDMLARDVWKESSRFSPLNNVIDVQMARLRRKVDDPFPVKLLHTIRGLGFSLREPHS